MGWFLAQALGPAYRTMTVSFRQGTVALQSLHGGAFWPHFGEVALARFPAAPPGTVEGALDPTARQTVLLDLRALPGLDGATAWFASPQFTRSIGGAGRIRRLERSAFASGWGMLVLPDTRPLQFWFAAGANTRAGATGRSN